MQASLQKMEHKSRRYYDQYPCSTRAAYLGGMEEVRCQGWRSVRTNARPACPRSDGPSHECRVKNIVEDSCFVSRPFVSQFLKVYTACFPAALPRPQPCRNKTVKSANVTTGKSSSKSSMRLCSVRHPRRLRQRDLQRLLLHIREGLGLPSTRYPTCPVTEERSGTSTECVQRARSPHE